MILIFIVFQYILIVKHGKELSTFHYFVIKSANSLIYFVIKNTVINYTKNYYVCLIRFYFGLFL